MNREHINKISLLLIATFFAGAINNFAQDSTKHELVTAVSYHLDNNSVMYVMVNTKTKIDKKFQQVANTGVTIYLDSIAETNLVAKLKTDKAGLAKAIFPPSLKKPWESAADHKIIAVTEANKEFEETETEALITKSKISIDTTSDGETKNIVVTVVSLKGDEWIPAKEVEMKIGVSRLDGSILPAGDEPTYTTDSSGSATVELKKIKMPGDEKGNIVLAANVEDNDQFGNLSIQKAVPWGTVLKPDTGFFNQRTLWSTRFRTPLWLLFMAWSIILGVWSTLIYLIIQLVKIKKLASTSA